MLGVGAKVYEGAWTGSKYEDRAVDQSKAIELDLAGWLKRIDTARDGAELKTAYLAAWNLFDDHDTLTTHKDARKVELGL
jgi:hypothetical protein